MHSLGAAPPRRRRLVATALGLLLAAACGGGGGIGKTEPPPPPPDGVTGRVYLRDYQLGRVAEQEPNDGVGQAWPLPPVAARTTLEVAGEAGTTAARYGRADPVDVLRFVAIEAQDVELTVAFGEFDPIGGFPNDLLVEVRALGTNALVAASPGGGSPQTVRFAAAVDEAVNVLLTVRTGHTPWLATFVATDPPVVAPLAPKPEAVALRDAGAFPAAPATEAPDCAPGHVLVRLKPGADPAAVAARSGFLLGEPTGSGSWRFRHAGGAARTGTLSQAREAARGLAADDDVLWAEPDLRVKALGEPGDPDFARQWNLRAIGAPAAWDVTTGAADVVVAVVDTGATGHPDLEGRTLRGYDFISDPDIAGDGDGRDPDPTDVGDRSGHSGLSTWHGTFVASIVAGGHDDGVGGCGVAPGCRVLPLRVLGVRGGEVGDVAAAILYAAGLLTLPDGSRRATPARVINLSLGLENPSAELQDACTRAANVGCLLVAAAGNSGGLVQYPAAYPEVLAVGAVGQRLTRAWYSSVGAELDLVAPGGDTREDANGDGWPDGVPAALYDETVHPRAHAIGLRDGTSGAAPHVAAAAALLWSVDPTLSVPEVRSLLTTSALDRGLPGRDDAYGHGLLQVHEAVRRLRAQTGTPLGAPPSLHLLQSTVKLHGLESSLDVPVTNGGGGTLRLEFVEPLPDDGGGWLFATLLPGLAGSASETAAVRVQVDRAALPAGEGRWSGTIRLSSATALLGTLRVVVYVQGRQHAGAAFQVLPEQVSNGMVPFLGTASPDAGYRYWLRGLAATDYTIRGGEDLDGDGTHCESAEACGFHGGPTEVEALLVTAGPDVTVPGVDVVLYAPTPP